MGLSAGQARLLTITARKSDCEFESMRLSHQKIALSRNMNQLSEEYNNSTAQTKLIYDYYGKGDQTTPLSYGILMQPSALNNYVPSPITDTSGRVVLDSRMAKAARDAGIPQEGLDGLPSSDLRNRFIDSLSSTGVINAVTAESIKKTSYNQAAGVGSADLVNVNTKTGTLQDLIEMVSKNQYDFSDLATGEYPFQLDMYSGNQNIGDGGKLSLGDLLNGNYSIRGSFDQLNGKDGLYSWSAVDAVGSSSFWGEMFGNFEDVLDNGDPYTQAALAYAKSKVMATVESLSTNSPDGEDRSNYAYYDKLGKSAWIGGKGTSQGKIDDALHGNTDDYMGIVYIDNACDELDDKKNEWNDGFGLNISNMAKAYLTYFAQYMEGISESTYHVDKTKDASNLIDDQFTFTLVTDVDVSGDDLLIAAFYDTLFNQICTNGWTENDRVTDPKYMQEMLKNGAMYISTLSDDGFYYQGNYGVNTYIKEVSDEEAIAQAEAKYSREKNKINYKENILDMKMKNLDTETSALSTEYDTVKSIIQKNIEKVFKRYSA